MSKEKLGLSTGKGFIEVYKDENGVIKCGGAIIPQRKLLFDSENEVNRIKIGSLSYINILTVDHSLENSAIELVTTHGIFKINCKTSNSTRNYFIYHIDINASSGSWISFAYGDIIVDTENDVSVIKGRARSYLIDLTDNKATESAAESTNNNELGILKIYEIIE